MRGGLILSNTFVIEFIDRKKITFSDVIDFEEDQEDEIKDIASRYTQTGLKMKQSGISLQNELTIDQKNVVIDLKKQVVNTNTAEQLIAMKLVKVLPHALQQLFQRQNKIAYNTEYVVNKLVHTDQVRKALFKGYKQLSYTMYSISDPEEFEIPISFLVKRGSPTTVQIITVYFADAIDTHTVNTIGERDEIKSKLLDFYRNNFE